MLLPYMANYAQISFYNMISETVDSCYSYSLRHVQGCRGYKVRIDDSYFPFGYSLSNIQYNHLCKKKYTPNNVYVGSYNAILRKDTILVLSYGKTYTGSPYIFNKRYKSKKYFTPPRIHGRMYRRKDKFREYGYGGGSKALLYVYTKEKEWESKPIKTRTLMDYFSDGPISKENVYLQDCIDFALNESINNFFNEYNYINNFGAPDIYRFLVFDNTFGDDFFFHKYFAKRTFPFLVASEQNVKKKELKKFYYIFGWCEIFLTGNKLTIVLRQVDGRKYAKKSLEYSTDYEYIYDFTYSDKQKKWVCINSLTIDHNYNSLKWKEYYNTPPTGQSGASSAGG